MRCCSPAATRVLPADQIATKLDSVYAVHLPEGVKQLLNSLSLIVSLGITPAGVSTPLECIDLSGYANTLRFYMITPVVLVALVVLVAVCLMLAKRRFTRMALVELALPPVLRILFLLYPLITNTAFDGFPCYEFADGTRWLKVASTPPHLHAAPTPPQTAPPPR